MHKPVLLSEVLQYLAPKDGETYIDATFGAGGYTQAILNAAKCRVIGIDQDPAVSEFGNQIKGDFKFIEGNFGNLEKLISEKVDGIVFDIGISSLQLDNHARGFSFQKNGPLDMRMGSHSMSAAEFLNSADENTIADIIYKYGEEKSSRRIAKEIVHSRPLSTTFDLVAAIHRILGKGGRTDSATKTFQAVRIYINDELEMLERGLAAAVNLLKAGGRLIVVTFHSLEDRIVKLFFKKNSTKNSMTGQPANRHQFLGHEYDDFKAPKKNEENLNFALEIITKKAIMPNEIEIMSNPRARSAKLRAATKSGS